MRNIFLIGSILFGASAFAQAPTQPTQPKTVNIVSISDLKTNGTEILYVINALVVDYGTKQKSCNYQPGKTTFTIVNGAIELAPNAKCSGQ